jgi:hypothetical protein
MSASRSLGRFLLAVGVIFFLAFLLAAAPTATAEVRTYNIVDYPAAEIDVITPGYQDSVAGTFTASTAGTLGSYVPATASAVTLSYSITLQSAAPGLPYPSVTYTGSGPLSNYLGSGSLTFTDTSMLLGGFLSFNGHDATPTSGFLSWRSETGVHYYEGSCRPPGYIFDPEFKFSDDGAHIGPFPWKIGDIPEPATLVLLGSALVGLVAIRSRRRAS